jgi:hypothetical protein
MGVFTDVLLVVDPVEPTTGRLPLQRKAVPWPELPVEPRELAPAVAVDCEELRAVELARDVLERAPVDPNDDSPELPEADEAPPVTAKVEENVAPAADDFDDDAPDVEEDEDDVDEVLPADVDVADPRPAVELAKEVPVESGAPEPTLEVRPEPEHPEIEHAINSTAHVYLLISSPLRPSVSEPRHTRSRTGFRAE